MITWRSTNQQKASNLRSIFGNILSNTSTLTWNTPKHTIGTMENTTSNLCFVVLMFRNEYGNKAEKHVFSISMHVQYIQNHTRQQSTVQTTGGISRQASVNSRKVQTALVPPQWCCTCPLACTSPCCPPPVWCNEICKDVPQPPNAWPNKWGHITAVK